MMSLPEAARSLGLAPATLRQQVKNGKLTARKVSRDWYVTEDEVARYRRDHLRDGKSEAATRMREAAGGTAA